ncbi:TetR/AcrR family transcriptional regulator [Aeromicrobium fastidiosum]|uniref:TetR/AcrR family transcriptional regulator n=1 Tax=Aeromicrobium fastidiosum TaxID=52699 RepID=A0A641AHP6_9ACTN|nr:TetR/AcrR family transcriptional regulator [Aeromicrobium fastidiosum]KAA1373050.1 TetR/AcrR family transcriptional regulator [Aeromicrobium fastidiosum]MBP2391031.1 AcrR family transcriptional regulator [Aeromicrobium fastidiosum]
MGRTTGRSPADTRRDILAAAAAALVQKGRSASLSDIANGAGVTKGGLLYHFGSKDELLAALARDLFASYDRLLQSMLDPDDDEPGRLCRAYIRSSFVPWSPSEPGFMDHIVLSALMIEPHVAEITNEFTVRLDEQLLDDGLPADVVDLIVAAADGASMQPLWWTEAPVERRAELEQRLLAMTVVH